VPLSAAHRARLYTILDGSYGADAAHTLAAGMFHRAHRPLEEMESSAVERAVQVVIEGAEPLNGHNNPLDGRDLSIYPVTVRVAYALTEAGDGYDAGGEQSGLGTTEAVEDRANMDLKLIRDAVGWQPSWASLDPVVIDCAPAPDAPTGVFGDDRAIYEQRFILTTRAALPGAYGPTTT
jgi:hypothetical protein